MSATWPRPNDPQVPRASSPGVESPTTGDVLKLCDADTGESTLDVVAVPEGFSLQMAYIERLAGPDLPGGYISVIVSPSDAVRLAAMLNGTRPVVGHPAAAPGSIEFATEQLDAGDDERGEGARTVKRPAAATAEPQPEFQPDEFPSGKLNATGQPASPSVPGDGFDVHELLGEYAMALASACHDLAGSIERQASTNARKALNAALDALLRGYEERGRVIEELADDGVEQGQDLKVACAEIDRLRTALEAAEADTRLLDSTTQFRSVATGMPLDVTWRAVIASHAAPVAQPSAASQGASGPEETNNGTK